MKDYASKSERLKPSRRKRQAAVAPDVKDESHDNTNQPPRRVWSFPEFISHVAVCAFGGWLAFKIYPHSQQFALLVALIVAIYGFGIALRR